MYVTRNNGTITALNARTGERFYQQRIAGTSTPFTSSTVAADGKLYFTSEEGDVYVVKAGPAFELLATNPLGDIGFATPAISEGTIYFRTAKMLVAVQ